MPVVSAMPDLALPLLALLAVACAGVVVLWRRSRRLAASLDQAESALDDIALRGVAPGLMPREHFERQLDAYSNDHVAFGVLCLDLDNLGFVNAAYGHGCGDAVIASAARRLARALPPHAAATRLGGDEFAVALCGTRDDAHRTALALRAALGRPHLIDGHELCVDVSIGIALHPQHGAGAQLVQFAGAARRAIKLAGGAAHAEFEASMGVDLRERAERVAALRGAVQRGELTLVYQPKIDARSLQITAAEALLRWNHGSRGVVAPATFIPEAERHGLIGAIGRWVIEEACRQAGAWRERGMRIRVAVNISGAQLRQDDLVTHLEACLRRHRIPPSRFTCEITESVAMEDTSVTRAAFERLRQAGVHVSIDDFGTGFSSLASLRRLPAAELKIDRSFVTDLASSAEARSIVRSIVQMARALEIRVVAEGV